MRMQMRRFTRLTTGYSKKIENHMHMVALYTVWYNWIRTHKAHRMTPAMADGLNGKLMEMTDVAQLIDDAEMRATVQKRVAALALPQSTVGPDRLKLRNDLMRGLRHQIEMEVVV